MNLAVLCFGALLWLVASNPPTSCMEDEPNVECDILEDHSYVAKIANKKAGYTTRTTQKCTNSESNEIVIRSAEMLRAKIQRGKDEAVISIDSRVDEDESGKVLRACLAQLSGNDLVTVKFQYAPNGTVSVTSLSSGKIHESILDSEPHSNPAGPYHAAIIFRALLTDDVSEVFAVRPEMGPNPIKVVRTKSGAPFEFQTQPAKFNERAQRYSVVMSGIADMEIFETYGLDSGTILETSIKSSMGDMITTISSKKQALAAFDSNEVRPELVVSSTVIVDKLLPPPTGLSSITLQVSTISSSNFEFPSYGYQTATRNSDGWLIHVDMRRELIPEYSDSKKIPRAFLESSAMITSQDDLVQRIAAYAIEESKCVDDLACALAIRNTVHRYISISNLETGYASAAQVARTRSGDCSEFAVLTAAMARSRNIPSRVCSGLVYTVMSEVTTQGNARQVGGYAWHMWTQVNVNGAWMDLDATLSVPYHPGHILVSCTANQDFEAHSESARIANLIGNLKVEILEYI